MSAAATATKVLSNKKVLVGIGIVVLVFVFYKNGPRWWDLLKRRDAGEYNPLDSNSQRQAELETMARDAYTVLHATLILDGVTWTGRDETLGKLLLLNDAELRFVATFYRGQLNPGHSLSSDVADEYWMGSVGEQLIAKLAELNL